MSVVARFPFVRTTLTLVAFFILTSGLPSFGAAGAESSDPIGLQTFDAVWRIINENHYDTNFGGVDWEAARKKYRPKAAAAPSPAQLRKTIQEMLDLLKLSHTKLLASEVAEEVGVDSKHKGKKQAQLEAASEDESATLPFDVRLVGKDLLVTRVWPGSTAADARIKPGWILTEINGTQFRKPVQRLRAKFAPERAGFLAWRLANGYLSGPIDSEATVTFLDGAKKKVVRKIKRIPLPGEAIQFGSLPILHAELSSEMLQPKAGLKIGYIRFNIWMLPSAIAFNKAIDQLRSADAIILDLRGNIGGVAGMVMGIAGHFFDRHLTLGTMKTREGELNFFVNPRFVSAEGERVQPFSGPLAIIVDEISASASEIFAGGLQDLDRARIFGRRTTGQALPAIHDLLPNGDILYHPFADFVTWRGTRIEGRGVIPDVPVPLKREDLLAGHDTALEAAVEWAAHAGKK
jgi:carboxyl-terminal processing protease